MVQGWYEPYMRWVPKVDPDEDGDPDDSELDLPDPSLLPGLWYPYPPYGFVSLGGGFVNNLYRGRLNEENFHLIPGLGRALKFTFTLYDSKGVIKGGRTFTHIVYLN